MPIMSISQMMDKVAFGDARSDESFRVRSQCKPTRHGGWTLDMSDVDGNKFIWKNRYPLVIQHSHGIDGPFIDDLPIETSIYEGFSMAMLNNQMVQLHIFMRMKQCCNTDTDSSMIYA